MKRALPVRMHLKHGGYYYVHQNKWTSLGREYQDALTAYARLIAPKKGGMPGLIERFADNADVSEKTRKTYRVVARRLAIAFDEFEPEDVKPSHVYQYFTAKEISGPMRSHYRSVMVGAMQIAVKEGLVDRNLMKEIENYTSPKRERYITDDEYLSIFNAASPTMRCIMDICYLTGQRIGDVISIKYSDLKEDGIFFCQQKTSSELVVEWSQDLRDAVATARALHQSVKGITLFHTRKGKKFTYSTIRTWWDRATEKAEVENAHIHDIRAKSASDAKKQGMDSMALLGHKSESVHKRYLRIKDDPPLVKGVRMVSKS